MREKIALIIDTEYANSFALPSMHIADQILALIKEEGWKSPEEVEEEWKDRVRQVKELFTNWHKED